MASRTEIIITDDIDGSEGASSVSFGLYGKDYEIDLSPEHVEDLKELLEPYIEAGRHVPRASQPGRPSRSRTSAAGTGDSGPAVNPTKVRQWAAEQGIPVAPRGRIAQSVIDAYRAGHVS